MDGILSQTVEVFVIQAFVLCALASARSDKRNTHRHLMAIAGNGCNTVFHDVFMVNPASTRHSGRACLRVLPISQVLQFVLKQFKNCKTYRLKSPLLCSSYVLLKKYTCHVHPCQMRTVGVEQAHSCQADK